MAHPQEWKDALATSDRAVQNRVEADIEQETTNIAHLLQAVGTAFDIDSLRESTWVLAGRVHPKYAKKIRDTFYKGFDKIADKDHRRKKYAELQTKVTGPMAGNADWYLCPGYGVEPHAVYRKSPTGTFTLDHGDSVVGHWNIKGRHGGQEDRQTFLSALGNLEGLCTSCNGRKSGREELGGKNVEYIQEVGPGFKGPDGT